MKMLIGSLVGALSITTAHANDQPAARLPLVQYGRGIAAKVEIGGKERLFQVDTAGGMTVVTPATARAIGCTPWGRIVGFHMRGARISGARCDDVRLRWGGLNLSAPTVLVIDVGSPDAPLDGLLALDAFAGRTITIDFARMELMIETEASARKRVSNATEIKAHLAREVGGIALSAFVEVPARHGPLRLELDSGNTGPNLVSRPLLGELGLNPVGSGGQMATLRLADGVSITGPIYGPDLVIDGNLGMAFLKDWVVTIDLAAGRVWLRRSAVSPPHGLGELPPPPASEMSKPADVSVVN
jgi:hypothetical protein